MKTTYVIKGKDFRSGREIFFDIDFNTGYPYGSTHSYNGFSNAKDAYDRIDEARGQFVNMMHPEVCKVVFEPVDISELDQAKQRAKFLLGEMSDEEIEAMRGLIK